MDASTYGIVEALIYEFHYWLAILGIAYAISFLSVRAIPPPLFSKFSLYMSRFLLSLSLLLFFFYFYPPPPSTTPPI